MVAPRSSSSNKKDTESKSSGPGGGSLNAPARTTPSTGRVSSNTAPSGSKFGPREKSTPVSTAPSSMARESTTDRLSRSGGKQITDRAGVTSQKPRSGPSIGPTEAAISQPARQKTSLNAMKGSPAKAYTGVQERIGQERLSLTGNPPSYYQRPMSQKDVEKSYQSMKNPTQRAYDINNPSNPGFGAPQYPKTQLKLSTTETTKSVEASSKAMRNPTQRAYDKNDPNYMGAGVALKPAVKPAITRSQTEQKPPIPKPKPDRVSTAPIPKAKPAKPVAAAKKTTKVTGKSKSRVAFEKEFAAAKARGEKVFIFKGKKYSTRVK